MKSLLWRIPLLIAGIVLFLVSFMAVLMLHYVDVMKLVSIDDYKQVIIHHGQWLLMLSLAASASIAISVRRERRTRFFLVLFMGPYVGYVVALFYINMPSTIEKLPVLPVFFGGLIFAGLVMTNNIRQRIIIALLAITATIVIAVQFYLYPLLPVTNEEQVGDCNKHNLECFPSADINTWLHVSMPDDFASIEMMFWEIYTNSFEGTVKTHPYAWAVYSKDEDVIIRDGNWYEYVTNKYALPFELPKLDNKWARMWEFRGNRTIKRVEDGWLLGFNAGEWGGSLWWFSQDGKRNYKISSDQIIQFLQMGDELYAIEGVAHLGLSRGTVLRIKRDKYGKWITSKVVELDNEPRAILPWHNHILVITSRDVMLLKNGGEIKTLLANAWLDHYPNSAVLHEDGCLYIGMYKGIAKWCIGEEEDSMVWLVPRYGYIDELGAWYDNLNDKK